MTVYKKDLQREQNAHLATKAKVAELEGVVSGLKEEVARLKQPVKAETSGVGLNTHKAVKDELATLKENHNEYLRNTVSKKDHLAVRSENTSLSKEVSELKTSLNKDQGIIRGLEEELKSIPKPKGPTVPKESYDKIKRELEAVSREKVEMVSKSSYKKLQTEKRKMSRQISQMVSINDYKDLVRSYEELKATPEKVVVRHVKVVDLSLVSKEELEKALRDAS